MLELLRERVGCPVSYASIAADVGVAPITVKKYVQVLEALDIVFRVVPHAHNIARSLLEEPKIHCFDTGLVKGTPGTRESDQVVAQPEAIDSVLVFAIDLVCSCGGTMRLIALLSDPAVLARICTHLGWPPSPPACLPARCPSQLLFDIDTSDPEPEDHDPSARHPGRSARAGPLASSANSEWAREADRAAVKAAWSTVQKGRRSVHRDPPVYGMHDPALPNTEALVQRTLHDLITSGGLPIGRPPPRKTRSRLAACLGRTRLSPAGLLRRLRRYA